MGFMKVRGFWKKRKVWEAPWGGCAEGHAFIGRREVLDWYKSGRARDLLVL